jgi:hypothetical protein
MGDLTKCKACPGIYKNGTMQNGVNMGEYYFGFAGKTVEAPRCTNATGASSVNTCTTEKCVYVAGASFSGGNDAAPDITYDAFYKPHNGRDAKLYSYTDYVYNTYINWPTFE